MKLLVTTTFTALVKTLSLCFILSAIAASAFANDVLGSGQLEPAFSSWGKASVKGDWKIIKADGKHYLELADNFKAKSGPDVKIFLSPSKASSITGDNATEGSVFIKLITDFEGKAQIELPANIDISQYKSLVFHCEEYSKLWGVSAL